MSSAASADNSAVRHVNIALYNSGKVLDDKANNKEGPDLNLVNGGKVNEDLLKDLLKTYEQAKLKMAGAFLQNSIDLRNSGLGQALQNDPVFQSLVQPTPTTAKISPEATLNFFKLVFKFLKDHKDDDSKIEVAQAMNMLVKENGLDDITKAAVVSMNTDKAAIVAAEAAKEAAENEADSKSWLTKIFMPIVMAVVSVIVIAVTLGAAAPAVVAADVAVTTAVEVGVEVGVDAGVEASVEASVEAGIEAGADAGAEAGADAGAEAGADAGADAGANVGTDGATQGAKAGAQDVIKETTQKGIWNAVKGFASGVKTFIGPAGCTLIKGAVIGAVIEGGLYGVKVGIEEKAKNDNTQTNNDYSTLVQEASSINQAVLTVNAAASDSVQNDIQKNMTYEQNAQSEMESDASMQTQVVNAMAKCYTAGNF